MVSVNYILVMKKAEEIVTHRIEHALTFRKFGTEVHSCCLCPRRKYLKRAPNFFPGSLPRRSSKRDTTTAEAEAEKDGGDRGGEKTEERDENLRVGKSAANDLDDVRRDSLLSVSHEVYDVSETGLVPDLRYSGEYLLDDYF